ncbi:MAG: pentapeptide repeat-containing protein [Gammaproteobacteria bacterium]|jgi:uncharacterized protein YjbI with pentapeptide repeats
MFKKPNTFKEPQKNNKALAKLFKKLPNEMHMTIIEFLLLKDIVNLSSVNKNLNQCINTVLSLKLICFNLKTFLHWANKDPRLFIKWGKNYELEKFSKYNLQDYNQHKKKKLYRQQYILYAIYRALGFYHESANFEFAHKCGVIKDRKFLQTCIDHELPNIFFDSNKAYLHFYTKLYPDSQSYKDNKKKITKFKKQSDYQKNDLYSLMLHILDTNNITKLNDTKGIYSDILKWGEYHLENNPKKILPKGSNQEQTKKNSTRMLNLIKSCQLTLKCVTKKINTKDIKTLQSAFINLSRADLQNADLKNANLQGANLQGANLQGANLENANLQGANLENADLQNANLKNANLKNADLQNADLQNANLQDADLQDANLPNTDLLHANLKNANLKNADLTLAKLQYASFQNADLQGTDLQGAILQGADLQNAYLYGSNLTHCNLYGIEINAKTIINIISSLKKDISSSEYQVSEKIKKSQELIQILLPHLQDKEELITLNKALEHNSNTQDKPWIAFMKNLETITKTKIEKITNPIETSNKNYQNGFF